MRVRWGGVIVVAAIGVAATAGAAAADASPAVGPQDSPTTQVPVTVRASCGGAPETDYPMVATVPTAVRAGRPFPVKITFADSPLPSTGSGYVRLAIGGGTQSEATLGVEGTGYLVAAGRPRQQLTLAIAGFGFVDTSVLIDETCAVESPVALPPIPVRHATPFDAAQLTAGQRVAILCLTFPGGRGFLSTQDVSVTVPNQVRVGEPFTIEDSAGVDVRGGVLSGQTVTPTGAVGDTVDFSFDGSFTRYLPPPFPPIPSIICDQRGGAVHLASVPIVAR